MRDRRAAAVPQESSLAGEPLLAGLTGGLLPAAGEPAAGDLAAAPPAEALCALDRVVLHWQLAWPLTEVATEVSAARSHHFYNPKPAPDCVALRWQLAGMLAVLITGHDRYHIRLQLPRAVQCMALSIKA